MKLFEQCARRWVILVAALMALPLAAEPDALQICVSCHGKDGVGINADYANLGGQNKAYLVNQLYAFRNGDRKNAVMNGMAAGLSDADIEALAAWYSGQQWVTQNNGDASLVEEGRNRAGYCHACHGMQGHPVAEEWPIIAGQSALYIENQLMGFKNGARYHPLMANVVKNLDPAAMKALAAYYTQVTKAD